MTEKGKRYTACVWSETVCDGETEKSCASMVYAVVPDAPKCKKQRVGKNCEVTMAWEEPFSGGAEITGYEVRVEGEKVSKCGEGTECKVEMREIAT